MAIPVSIQDARRQIQLDEDDETRDADLTVWIADAAAWVEKYTGHILVALDVTQEFSGSGLAPLRAWPVKPTAAVTVSYPDASGNAVPMTGMRLSAATRPARIIPSLSCGFSAPRRAAMTVTVRAGYEPSDHVPGNFRRAMLILISAYDSDREGGEVFQNAEKSARGLCRDFRLRQL